ncbi:MAG: AMP-binding protein [Candidatus Fermentibacteria bacterium]
MPRTVHGLLKKWAAGTPETVALEDDQRKLTFADWQRVSFHVASLLQKAGVCQGHVVGVVSSRSSFLPCAFTAVSILGAKFVSLNPDWPEQERMRVFDRWSDRLLLALDSTDCCDQPDEMILSLNDDIFEGSEIPVDIPDLQGDEEFYLNVTSASTGQAKVAPTTHSQLISNTRGVTSSMGLTADDVHLSLFGVFGHPHELFMRGLYLGGRTVLTEHRYPRDLLHVISRTGITAIMALPTQLLNLSRLWNRIDADLQSVRIAEAGGMYVSEDFAVSFTEKTGVELVPVWGSTETAGVVLTGVSGVQGFTTVVEGYRIEIRDLSGSRMNDSGSGELWISGSGVVNRYIGDRPQTEEAFLDGWYRTGDMFRTENGGLIFLGRRGGLIKAAGLKVYPLEVELAILKHPLIVDACVVGRDHPSRGEMPSAYIVARPGTELTVAEMRAFLRQFLDEHKIPRLINFVHGLPRTANGKIDRKAVGTREIVPDFRGELLRSDVELVRLVNQRAELMNRIGGGFDPSWVDDQVDNAVGHNAGPVSDSSIRDFLRFIISELGKR